MRRPRAHARRRRPLRIGRRLTPALLGLAAIAAAAPGESEPQPVVFADWAQPFDTIVYDTGYWPSPSDPISIRLFLTPTGGVQTRLNGRSEVSWPPLGHRVASDPGGLVTLDAELAVGAEVKLDLLGVFTGTVPLATESVRFLAQEEVDGLLLPGNPVEEVELTDGDAGSIPDIAWTVPVIAGVNLVASVGLTPTVSASVRGVEVVSEIGAETLAQTEDALRIDLPPDPGRPGELGVLTHWEGVVDADLDLVVEPEVRVDSPLGQFVLARFPIPVTLVGTSAARATEPQFVVHPMPVLDPLPAGADLGPVDVGAVGNAALPFENLGELLLEGTLRIEGDPAFTVWPPSVAAQARTASGFVVSFAPEGPGEHQATLSIDTNDPTMP
ncbi:MAG: hypothetical protein R3F59_29525 [Myxococcota bacterium]